MILVGGYNSLKLYIYNKINNRLTEKITFSDLALGIFPPGVRVDNLHNFDIKDENIVSFEKVSLHIPLLSIFSKIKDVNLSIHKPVILLNEKILKKSGKAASGKLPFAINRINIIDGEMIYNSKKLIVNLLKFNLSSTVKGGKTLYKLTTPHLKVIIPYSKRTDLLQLDLNDETQRSKFVKIEGDMMSVFRPQRTSWKVRNFAWNTKDMRLTVNGRVFKNGTIALNAFVEGDPEEILDPILRNLRPQGYMEAGVKIRRRRKETLYIEGEFDYNTITVGGQALDQFRGTGRWNNRTKQIEVDAFFMDGPLNSRLNVRSKPGDTFLHGENASAEKIAKLINIHDMIPIGGIMRQADIRIRKRIFTGSVELQARPEVSAQPESRAQPEFQARPEPQAQPESQARRETTPDTTPQTLFHLDGKVDVRYNSKKKSVIFSTTDAKTEFGSLVFLEGDVDPTREVKLKIKAKGRVNRMGELHRYSNFYINLDLQRWKLQKGRGTIEFDLKKIGKLFYVESDLDINDFTSSGQTIQNMKGHLSTKKSLTSGTFTFTDKDLTGRGEIYVGRDFFTIDFKEVAGESEKVLKIIDIDLSLKGRMLGQFHLIKKSSESSPLVRGSFRAKRINFYDFFFDDVSGNLEYQDTVTLDKLSYRYNDGRGTADIFLDYDREIYSMDGEVKGVDISRLQPAFKGLADITFRGDGVFDKDPIKLTYSSGGINFYEDRRFRVQGTGNIFTDFADFRIDARGDMLNDASASPFIFKLNRKGDAYTGSFNLTLTDINQLIPWGNNIGNMDLEARLTGTADGDLSAEGRAVFSGRYLAFPNFPHVLENFMGEVLFKDLDFQLRTIKGTMGGGNVESSGRLAIKDNSIDDLSIRLVGKNMNLYPVDRTNFTMDADLTLNYVNEKLLLAGRLDALSGIWRREVDEGFSFNTDPSLTSSGSRIMDLLEFDLKLTGDRNIQLDNSFGKATGKFDLRLTGNPDFPILLGSIDCREGELVFSDRKFDLVKAKIVFNNKFMIDPLINVESESFIKNYRVKFNIKGTSERMKPELQSSPPLPPGDIMTLISLGELFERPTSAELSSRIGTVTTGLLASEVTDAIKKRTKKLFGDFMLNIDPNISDIAGVSNSRLIVGKEISKQFLVVVATNFSTQRQQQVVYLQYHLTPSISLIGMRNEEGHYSLDLRLRKRR